MRSQFLRRWLDELSADARPRVLVGGTGHLILSRDEEEQAARELERAALPALLEAPADAEILVLTGMAPGADLLIAETASTWLTRHDRRFARIALLPVPTEVLWGDWLTRAPAVDAARIETVRQRFDAALRRSDTVVQLWDDLALDWAELSVRQQQYRRLAAVLVEHCEVLVAVLKPARPGAPGGTAEVVAWREGADFDRSLACGRRRHASAWPGGDRLLKVDPSITPGGAAGSPPWIRAVRDALRGGNALLGYDRVLAAEAQGHASDELQYLKLLTQASAGSTQAALRQLHELPASVREQNEDWLALEGRLYKDLAAAAGSEGRHHYEKAAACYRAAFLKTGGYFSAINAATTTLLAGQREQARWLAQDVLGHVCKARAAGDADRYYLRATEAEAALILGDEAGARAALAAANALWPDNLSARGRTRAQLRLVCRAIGIDDAVVETLHVPPVVYLPPPAPGAPPPAGTLDASFVYAALTDPAALAAAEGLQKGGARLHVVLAAPRRSMLAHWQAVHGAGLAHRLDLLLEAAHGTSVALGFLPREERWCDRYVAAMALGLSRMAAQRLGCAWRSLGEEQAVATPPQAIEGTPYERRLAGVIFADFAGFSRLRDEDLPVFWARFMQAIGERLAAHGGEVLLQQTWGDALHVVTANAAAAAAIACEIQDTLERLRPSLPGPLARLELRLSAHYAPVFAGTDPIEGQRTFFGTQLSFTARIEPVTPPGMIFVTEALAAALALEAPGRYAVEYAGDVTLAKAYGQTRLLNLRRSAR
jgi:hypothetical protein